MEERYYDVGPVQTRVLSFGDVMTEDEVVLVIPGNPGITDFYVDFMEKLHSKLGMPVLVVSHAGHDIIPRLMDKPPQLKGNHELYDVAGQVKHKKDFICKYLHNEVKINLVGHSIGCKMILDLLKDEDISYRLRKGILLFPTIERMAESPNGKLFTGLDKYFSTLLLWLMVLLKYVPHFFKMALIKGYSWLTKIPLKFSDTIGRLVHPVVLEKVYYMAQDEMKTVRSLDIDGIMGNISKLHLYYGTTDRWCPMRYFHEIRSKIPEIKAQLCKLGYRHAFVLNDPTEMAYIVGDWIKS
ncbi:lipid droplet-associated hydrolase [Ischnura elegans]|uniref:lipid droplet-associated hydrolase n=1 Tax=Ischnura elegans TaxID=197161 RepID=UPI001ED8BFAA|nr:lipid droplet-associated hydrolase [Ischnura elegans]